MLFVPYFQTTRYRVRSMVELADIKPEDRHADLGAGDGRIVIAFAKQGITSCGYELDERLVNLAEENIQKAKQTVRAFIYKKDFWQEDLSNFSLISVYGMPDIMEVLANKLQRELHPGSRVLSNYYPFPAWQHEKMQDHIYLYRKT